MALKYKLVEKSTDPRDKEAPKNWYAVPQSESAMDVKDMTHEATKGSTLAPIELEAGLDLLADFVPSQLLQGHTVVIPRLGRFRLTFKSKGAAEVNDFSPTEMIYDVRAVFTPDADFRQRIKQGITFEDGGVMKDDISYKTRLDYLKAIGEVPDDGTEDEGEQGIPNP